MRLHLLEVVAGAERLSGAGEHDDARLVVIGDVVERRNDGLDHREAQRIAVVRRVQSQDDDAVVVVPSDELRRRDDG